MEIEIKCIQAMKKQAKSESDNDAYIGYDIKETQLMTAIYILTGKVNAT
jgi:hypothetical protein